MTEDFNEFLKKKTFRGVENTSSPEWLEAHHHNLEAMKSIRLIDLGEWTLEKAIPLIHAIYSECNVRNYLRFNVVQEYLDGADFSELDAAYCLNEFWKIAIACLSKEGIEKRLKELSKKKKGGK